jgi:hypothetical protein
LRRDAVLNIGPVKWQSPNAMPDVKKFDVYTSPRNENFTQYNQEQTADIHQCVYNYYISNVIQNTNYLLLEQG